MMKMASILYMLLIIVVVVVVAGDVKFSFT